LTTIPSSEPGRGIGSLVARLTGVNIAVAASSLVTGPIQAQVLGPSGRGEVAAVIVTLAVAAWILDFGLTTFVARARAQATEPGLLYGTVVPLSCAFSLVGVAVAFPLAQLLGQDRHSVELFITIGLLLSPLTVGLLTLSGALWGEERWRLLSAMRLSGALMSVTALAVLALADELTVTSAIISLLLAGLLSNALILPALRGTRPWRFGRRLAREAVTFGAHNWLASLAFVANFRLDQMLMAGLVSSRQLGLYAVAVTTATFSSVFIGALTFGLFPRVARGDSELARRSCRIALSLVALTSIVAAALIPVVLPLLFGDAFRDAVPMALILLVAGITSAFVSVLGVSLAAAGHPRETVRPQVAGLVLGIPLLIFLLPSTGGVGASVISVGTGMVSAALMLLAGLRVFSGRPLDFLLPTREDLGMVRRRVLTRERSSLGGVPGP
jgi:O-antigen/teichoic acid export membrane protein